MRKPAILLLVCLVALGGFLVYEVVWAADVGDYGASDPATTDGNRDQKAGSIAFMGDYLIHSAAGLKNADPVQSHYFELLHPGESRNIWSQALLKSNYIYRGRLAEANRDDDARDAFWQEASANLSESGWTSALK